MLENPPVTNCGFVYLLFTCVVGLIGLILFSVAAKKYKYRRRDEGIFCQYDVEEIYDRYLTGSVDEVQIIVESCRIGRKINSRNNLVSIF